MPRKSPPLRRRVAALLLAALLCPALAKSYSVLSHEALIDAVWNPFIVPLLLRRYPNATPAELQRAHAFAYGGSVIQDMGYYPLGNRFFSNLAHYVRGAAFIEALLHDSANLDEYAFALGALSHYAADNTGHPLAVNLSVADLYPKLERKYGKRVTYEDDPTAHIMVEFSFDVVQIAGSGYLPKTYHNYIGFKVPRRFLNRAFADTYGLRLNNLYLSEGLSIWIYQLGASEVIPRLTQVVWKRKRKKILRLYPAIVNKQFVYRVSEGNYRRTWSGRGHPPRFFRRWISRWRVGTEQEQLGLFANMLVFTIELLPKVGRLRALDFKPPTPHTQALFIHSFGVTVGRYRGMLQNVEAHRLLLENRNFDTGRPIHAGDYWLADKTYAQLLSRLAARHFATVTPPLRDDILGFYRNGLGSARGGKSNSRAQRKLRRELAALKKSGRGA
jgi:Zinc dependent phospholipase C